jgi:tetratricopeptide (TPR) repeat protein
VARRPLEEELHRLKARLPRKSDMVRLLGYLGSIRGKQGRHGEAEALFERALGLIGDSDDMSAISLMVGLARVHADQGRYADAEQLYTRALQLDEEDRRGLDEDGWGKRRRPPDLTSAGLLNHLGQLSRKRNRLERAELLHKRALQILEELGPDRIDVGTTLNDLAEVYRDQGKFAEAEPLYRRALELCEKGNLSPNHGLVRAVLANLAALYESQGRHAGADRLKRGGPHADFWVR